MIPYTALNRAHCAAHGTAMHCTELYQTAFQCTALHITAVHCTALHHTALHCTTLHYTALHCTALCRIVYFTTLQFIVPWEPWYPGPPLFPHCSIIVRKYWKHLPVWPIIVLHRTGQHFYHRCPSFKSVIYYSVPNFLETPFLLIRYAAEFCRSGKHNDFANN